MTPGGRITFIDALRGVAIVLMVVNHTARDWMDGAMGWGRYHLIYGTLLFPAALFLFLAGFSLPIAYRRAAPPPRFGALVWNLGRRAAGLALAGLALNALIGEPLWYGGVLQTIGIAIVLAGATLPVARHPTVRWALAGIAVTLYVTFTAALPALTRWSAGHPIAGRALFNDFPAWPWVGVTLLGLVAGWAWLDAREAGPGRETRFFAWVAVGGLGCLAAWAAWEWMVPTTPRFGFPRDWTLNRHWTPRGMTLVLVAGGVACLLALTYWLVERRGHAVPALVLLGRTALMLYVAHQVIERTLMKNALGLRIESWWLYAIATAALLASLVPLGYAWRRGKT